MLIYFSNSYFCLAKIIKLYLYICNVMFIMHRLLSYHHFGLLNDQVFNHFRWVIQTQGLWWLQLTLTVRKNDCPRPVNSSLNFKPHQQSQAQTNQLMQSVQCSNFLIVLKFIEKFWILLYTIKKKILNWGV